MNELSKDQLDEIRARHDATLIIDWQKEFDPKHHPVSLTNAEKCHQDRAALLQHAKALQAKLDAVTDGGWRSCIDHIIKPDSPCPVCRIEQPEAAIK